MCQEVVQAGYIISGLPPSPCPSRAIRIAIYALYRSRTSVALDLSAAKLSLTYWLTGWSECIVQLSSWTTKKRGLLILRIVCVDLRRFRLKRKAGFSSNLTLSKPRNRSYRLSDNQSSCLNGSSIEWTVRSKFMVCNSNYFYFPSPKPNTVGERLSVAQVPVLSIKNNNKPNRVQDVGHTSRCPFVVSRRSNFGTE